MRDIRSLLLVLLSVGLVATWVYHIYDKAKYSRVAASMSLSDSAIIAAAVRDSLQKEYTSAINTLDDQLDSSLINSDSLQMQLDSRIKEINLLKQEISRVLKNPKSTGLELADARRKMAELEQKLTEMNSQNISMEEEKKNMTARLDKISGEFTSLEQNIRKLDEENKDLREKVKQASVFMTSGLHLAAIDVKNDEKEQETVQTRKADKFVASFVLQNNVQQQMNAEVFVIITQPDGKVLQNSAWESGMFDSNGQGRKSYTRKVKFDYDKGEQKRLIFSLETDNFQPGKYTMQVWHHGLLVGETFKTLR
jgi:DNA repair exonuclease SbcCD ATPase subunit